MSPVSDALRETNELSNAGRTDVTAGLDARGGSTESPVSGALRETNESSTAGRTDASAGLNEDEAPSTEKLLMQLRADKSQKKRKFTNAKRAFYVGVRFVPGRKSTCSVCVCVCVFD